MTAPQFTLEQLAEEHASLSEEEKNWVHNDVYGTNYPTDDAFEVTVNETTEFLAELTELTKEQMDALPEMKKAAYLEAVEKCPDEIEYVANPIRFLRCMNYLPKVSVFVCMELCVYGVVSAKRTHLFCARLSLPTHPLTDQRTNGFFLPCSTHPFIHPSISDLLPALPQDAASRMASYWKMRKHVFKDRAFRNMMSLDGTGCLSQFEIDFLEKYGATTYHVLPNDRHGRGVVYLDRRTEKIAWKATGAKKENAVSRCTVVVVCVCTCVGVRVWVYVCGCPYQR